VVRSPSLAAPYGPQTNPDTRRDHALYRHIVAPHRKVVIHQEIRRYRVAHLRQTLFRQAPLNRRAQLIPDNFIAGSNSVAAGGRRPITSRESPAVHFSLLVLPRRRQAQVYASKPEYPGRENLHVLVAAASPSPQSKIDAASSGNLPILFIQFLINASSRQTLSRSC